MGVNVSLSDSPAESASSSVVAAATPPGAASPFDADPAPAPTPVASVSWETASGEPFTLPVYDGAEVSADFGADPAFAAERAELVRTGRYAGEWRQEYTVPLEDGRLLTIPVHAVGVRGPAVF